MEHDVQEPQAPRLLLRNSLPVFSPATDSTRVWERCNLVLVLPTNRSKQPPKAFASDSANAMYSPQLKFKANLLTQHWQINLKYCLKAPGFKVYKISFRVQTKKKKNKAYQILCDFLKMFKLYILQPPELNLCQPCSDSQEKGVISETQPDAKPCGYHHSRSWLPSHVIPTGIFMSTAITLRADCHNDSPSGKDSSTTVD